MEGAGVGLARECVPNTYAEKTARRAAAPPAKAARAPWFHAPPPCLRMAVALTVPGSATERMASVLFFLRGG